MPSKSVNEYAQQVAGIFQSVDQTDDSQKILQALEELRDIFNQVKGQSKYVSLVPVINEAMIELNSAIVFNEIADLRDNAKKLKPLIETLKGINEEAKETTKALRLEKLQLFLKAANEAAVALTQAKAAMDTDDLSSAGPTLQTAWEKINILLEQLKREKKEIGNS